MTSNELVGAAKTLSVGAAYAVTVTAAMNTAVGLSQSEEVALNKEIIVGKKIDIISAELIEIGCGKSLIQMSQSGLIEIKGTQVMIEQYEPHYDERYKRQFVLKTESGEPIGGQAYKVTFSNGEQLCGITNQQGETAVYTTKQAEDLQFELTDQEG